MNTEKIMEDIQSVQDNIREIKSTWGNTIMTLDNIKSGLKADVQKKVDEAYQRGHDDGYEAGCATAFKPVSDAEYQRGYDEGYKKCLSENDFDQPCVSCDDYQRGLNDAWEAAKKIMNMSDPPYWDVFGEYKNELFKKFSVSEAIAKLKAYESKQKDRIEVGDEVISDTGTKKFTVTVFANSDTVCGISERGLWCFSAIDKLKKTGKHYDIQSILGAMQK